jgi:COP9 signalosome complex subunit 5
MKKCWHDLFTRISALQNRTHLFLCLLTLIIRPCTLQTGTCCATCFILPPHLLRMSAQKADHDPTIKTDEKLTPDADAPLLSDAHYYACNAQQLADLRTSVPWTNDAKYFTTVAISPSAIMKIMMHCASGVEKGIASGGNPIEVMGMLLGRPDPVTPNTLVVTDAFPLPIEGFETRVIADDEGVTNHMIALGESLEGSRRERFFGWYHSHPFDVVGDHSHCFLSQTDLSTQLQWQRAEDPHGNPFVAIVVDPLRSAHLETPQLKAFRAYPPEYSSAIPNECPDGTVEASEQTRLEHWGSCWNRYYELKLEYYMSTVSRSVLEQLTQDYLWIRTLTPTEEDTGNKLEAVAKQFRTASSAPSAVVAQRVAPRQARAGFTAARGELGQATVGANPRSKEWNKGVSLMVELASGEVSDMNLRKTKERVFS